MQAKDKLLSVGIDIGTTTTHLVVTGLSFANLAGPTQISEICITDKQVLFESPVYQTPLNEEGSINASAVATLIEQTYREAAARLNLDMTAVQTGAVIITGESARTRNAQEVLEQIANFAGDFVVESAGPNLESILCARGSGAQARSREDSLCILSLDIGGGTSNFAVIDNGEIDATAAVSIGGRAVRFAGGKISHLSQTASVLSDIAGINLTVGASIDQCQAGLTALANLMAKIVVDISSPLPRPAKGESAQTEITARQVEGIWLTAALHLEKSADLIYISGGVAELMQTPQIDLNQYQDFGVYLARALIAELQDRGLDFVIAANAIRATVLGAGMHTLQLTGSTIDFAQDSLPLRNAPLVKIDLRQVGDQVPEDYLAIKIQKALALKQLDWSQKHIVLALSGLNCDQLQYPMVKSLALSLAQAFNQLGAAEPLVVAVDQDIAMALGLLLKRLLPDKRIITVDGVVVRDGDYIDIGRPLHSNSLSDQYTQTLPVVVKTLIFYKN